MIKQLKRKSIKLAVYRNRIKETEEAKLRTI